jgi:hypothetical protein
MRLCSYLRASLSEVPGECCSRSRAVEMTWVLARLLLGLGMLLGSVFGTA